MGRSTTPSFIRDPDQAARLAALLRDEADTADETLRHGRAELTRRQITQDEQHIAELRRWADELDPPADAPATPPTHIRPARDLPPAASDA